ncbi:serine protease [Carboxylicivirga sp. M1479]|uniref:S1 family peptidase n=1 Tax=Carboxylicivirga sp. M1479 TaxID=2594476 RepID=UPI0011781633|nr:serine protease [Carboxylicivirga sp. M1479]TRX72580.1 trypsin-like peptidase domain-containing protein [Carboxylicivirga sp. M1479]
MYRELNKRFAGAVFMLAKKTETNVEFLGTGFLVSRQGHIMTCSHIINPIDSIVAIKVGDGQTFNPMTLTRVNFYEVTLVQNDAQHDVALLKLKSDIGAQVPDDIFGDTDQIECGSSVALIGFPFGDRGLHVQTIAHGILSSKVIDSSNVKLLQFDCMIHEGNSGSPLLDLRTNKIIGIVTNRFNPLGGGGGISIGNRQLGVDTNISYAASIEYGIELLENEK